MMSPYAAQSGFEITKDYSDLTNNIFDSDSVSQIVINLIDNAIKYAQNAPDKKIIIRTKQHDGFAVIEVEDHGPGLPHAQRKKVFEEFYRCGDESKRSTTGTGLGLALVKKFAQAHNGFVDVITAKPSGVIFKVSLAIKT